MSFTDLLVLITVSLLILLLPAFGLYKLFPKAGIPAWKAWVPFLNSWEMIKAEKLRKHWFFWQFIPVAGWFISLWILTEFIKLFGKFSLKDHALAVLVPFIYYPMIANDEKDTRFIGPEAVRKHRKSPAREWIDAAIFAIVAATLIRIFVFEAYVIPTGSMEKTLLVNDFLFVSKLSYGPRIPNTPLAVPFVHHTLPVFGGKSYIESVNLPYRRWFSSPVKRNDVVVFNFPVGDTLTREFDSQDPYYDILRREERRLQTQLRSQYPDETQLKAISARRAYENVWDQYRITTRPVDKRENYIKRCVAIAGDSLQLINGRLYINGEPGFVSPTEATEYHVITSGRGLTPDVVEDAGIMLTPDGTDFHYANQGTYVLNLTESEVEKLRTIPGVDSIEKIIVDNYGDVFPYDAEFHWSVDNFGPLWVPAKGAVIDLTPRNVKLYKRLIRVYEQNTWEERDGRIFINGKESTQYTFKMDYFWMMGDNRHRSQDSRFWGFVPEDHVVGEAWMIWMSWNEGPRWNRIFNMIH